MKSLNLEKEIKIGKKVAVIGGGNTAVDAARCCIRLGVKEVHLIYRRTKEEMPAIFEGIKQAEEAAVKILYLTAPVEIVGKNGRVSQLKCIPLVLGSTNTSGRRKPSPIAASCFSLEIDTVIVAISQTPDLSFLEQINQSGSLTVDFDSYATNIEGIFAAGDVVTGPATVIEAIAGGKKAAISIDRYLKGESLKMKQGEKEVIIPAEKVLREKGFVEPKKRKIPSFIPSSTGLMNCAGTLLGDARFVNSNPLPFPFGESSKVTTPNCFVPACLMKLPSAFADTEIVSL